jgi:hypothetical protein
MSLTPYFAIKDGEMLFAIQTLRNFVFENNDAILASKPEEYVTSRMANVGRRRWGEKYNEADEKKKIIDGYLGNVLYHLGEDKILLRLENSEKKIVGILIADVKVDDITEESYEIYLNYMFVLPDAEPGVAETLIKNLAALGQKLYCNKIIISTVYKSEVSKYKALGFDFRFSPTSSICYDMNLSVKSLPPPLPGKNEISTNLRKQSSVSVGLVLKSAVGEGYVETDPDTQKLYMMTNTIVDDDALNETFAEIKAYTESDESVCGDVMRDYINDRLVPNNEFINFVLFVKKGDDMKGFALCEFSKEKIILDLLCGAPGIKGAGEILLKAIQVVAFSNGIKSIELSSLGTSYGFYRKYGFCFQQEKVDAISYSMEYPLRRGAVGGARTRKHARRRRGHMRHRRGRTRGGKRM